MRWVEIALILSLGWNVVGTSLNLYSFMGMKENFEKAMTGWNACISDFNRANYNYRKLLIEGK